MFHEVKIFDPKGKMKKVLSSKVLSRRYWKSFFDPPKSGQTVRRGKRRQTKSDYQVDQENMYFSDS